MSNQELKFSSLPPNWQALVRKMQELNFGLLIDLRVYEGIPEMTGDFFCVSQFKFPGDSTPRPESKKGDFVLQEEVCQFIEAVEEMCCGEIPKVTISHGLPVHMEVPDYTLGPKKRNTLPGK